MKYYTDTRLKEIVQMDYALVKDYLVKYYEHVENPICGEGLL